MSKDLNSSIDINTNPSNYPTMAPTAINSQSTGAVPDSTALKGKINGETGTDLHIIDPEVLTRPNIALWVTKDHKWVNR